MFYFRYLLVFLIEMFILVNDGSFQVGVRVGVLVGVPVGVRMGVQVWIWVGGWFRVLV